MGGLDTTNLEDKIKYKDFHFVKGKEKGELSKHL